MSPENGTKSAFVIRGVCNYSPRRTDNGESFKLKAEDIISFKFDINGKIIEYTDHEADISFDKFANEWVIVLDDLPFELACKTVKLRDIWLDENMIHEKDFVFIIHSFESTSKTAILSVDLEKDHSDMVEVEGEGPVKDKPMQHIKFLYRSDYDPEDIEAALNTIYLLDKSTDTRYDFNVFKVSTTVDDHGILVLDAEGVMYDIDNAICISADYILDDDSDFIFTGIELDGSFCGEPGGFIDVVECEYNGIRIPHKSAPAVGFRLIKSNEKNCRIELVYYSVDVNAVIDNIDWVEISLPDNVNIRVMIDHTKPVTTSPGYNYSNTSKYYISGVGGSEFYSGDDDLTKIDWEGAAISCIKWHDNRPIVLFESASMIINGKHYGIVPLTGISDDITRDEVKRQKMAIQLKNSSIPVQDPVFVVSAEVRSQDLGKDLHSLIHMFINLDGVHHNISKLEVFDIVSSGAAGFPGAPMHSVMFKIKPIKMGSYGSDVPVKTLHFGNIVVKDFDFSNDKLDGFHMELKEIMFNGSTVKIALDHIHNVCVDYTEPVIIQDKSETKTKKKSYNYPVIQVVTFIRGDVETHVNNISSLLIDMNGTKYQIDDMKSIIRSKFLEPDGRYRVMIDFVPLHLISKKGELDVHYLYAYDDIKFTGFSTESIVAGEIDPIKVYLGGKEIPIAPPEEQPVYVDVVKSADSRKVTAEFAFKVKDDRPNVDFYQVRAISVDELPKSVPATFKVKPIDSTVDGYHNNHEDMDMNSTNVCSELVVQNGCHIKSIIVLAGGYVTIEEGGHVDELCVHVGGIAELCDGATVDNAIECGGAIYGNMSGICFHANGIHDGKIDKDQYATLHEGTIMWNTSIYGSVDARDNTHMCDCTIHGEVNIHGGYHERLTIKEGGSAFIDGGVVRNLVAANGSRVVIFHAATIFDCVFYGEVEYEGDFIKSPRVVNCKSDELVKKFELDADCFKSVDELFDELHKD